MFNRRRAIKLALLFSLLAFSKISALFADSRILFNDPASLRTQFVDISTRWDYYGSELVDPENFYPVFKAGPSSIVGFPHTMNDGETLGTYHLRLSGLLPYNRYSSDFCGAVMTACRIWCNGKIVATGGFLSKDQAHSKPGDIFMPVDFQADKDGVVDIVVHISNFTKCKGGIAKRIKLSEISALRKNLSINYFLNVFILAFIIAHIIYNAILGSLNIKQLSYGTLIITCIFYCCAITLTGHSLVLQRAITLPFWLHRKIAVLILSFISALDLFFAMNIQKMPSKKTIPLVSAALAIAFIALFTPLYLFERLRWFFVYTALGFSLLRFIIPLKFVLKRNIEGRRNLKKTTISYNINMVITLIIFLCRINDFVIVPLNSSPIHPFIAFKLSILLFGVAQCGIYAFNRDISFMRVSRQMEKLSFTNNTLSKIVPSQVLKLLGAGDVTKIIPGESRIIDAVLFYVEIKHFNRLAESIEKEELYSIQTEFFQVVSPIIIDSGGFVAKYSISGCLAIFQHKNSDAIICASRLQKKMRDIRRHLRKTKRTDISIGIAIHYGKVAIGTIGTNNRLDTMALSEDVNITYAVGKQTSKTNTQILITEEAMPYCRGYINYVYEGHYFISNGNQILVYSALPIKKGDQSFEDTLEPIEEDDED